MRAPDTTEMPCECCGRDVDSCICEECPRCGVAGNPECYAGECTEHDPCPKCFEGKCTNAPGMNCPPPKLRYTKEQRRGQAYARIADLRQRISDENAYVAWLDQQPDEWRDE